MDVNYSRWMSKDPDAEPDVIEDEPRRFSLPRPSQSAVASTAMVSLIVLGAGAFVRSIATPEDSAAQVQTVETPTARSEPGAASVDDSAPDDSTSNDSTSDDSTLDDTLSDDSTSDSPASDDSATSDWSVPAGAPPDPPQIERREFGPPNEVQPGPRMRIHFRDQRVGP